MDTAHITALLEPFLETPLSAPQLDQISIYIDLLLRWNARINLTAIRQEEEIVTRHFGESVFMARHLFPTISDRCHPERSQDMSEAQVSAASKDPSPSTTVGAPSYREAKGGPPHVLDIGSGAGFPAFPVKIWAPHIASHADRVQSQESGFPPRSGPSTYIDEHQCNRRPDRNPDSPPGFSESRRSNPPSRRALRENPPPSRNLPGSQRPLSLTSWSSPDPERIDPHGPEMASKT